MPIHENNGSIICLLSIYGNNRTIICPQQSSSQRGRIWDEIGDLFGNTFYRSSLLLRRMITLEDYKVEPCQTLEDRRMSSDGITSANRNEMQTFNVYVNLNIINLNKLSLVTLMPRHRRTLMNLFFWAGQGSSGLNLYFLPPKAEETKPTKV